MSDDLEGMYQRRHAALAEVNRVRGDFLAAMIDLEAHIDRGVVYFFAPDELRIFLDTVLERLQFATKLGVFRKLLGHAGLLDEKNRKLLKDIDDLRIQRNRFAHEAFEFVGNSFMDETGNYRLYRKERLDARLEKRTRSTSSTSGVW